MKLLPTIVILLITVVVLPIVAFQFDRPLDPLQTEMLRTGVYMMLTVAGTCFVVSELTGNCSQVDKLWSVVPIAYTWFFAWKGGWDDRLVLMACLATVWALRLSYNFGRRGGYSWKIWGGEEDYRWSVLRQNPILKGRFRWMLFNLFFISLYQHTLILLFTLPMVPAWEGHHTPLGWADYLLAALYLGFVVMETIADQQQWEFQTEKYRRINNGLPLDGTYARGFVSSGLWGRMRHPNYAAEQAIWVVFYLFSVVATGRWMNWSMAGCLLLLVLFQGSSDFSEEISAGKYPEYRDYQRRVPRFIPKLW